MEEMGRHEFETSREDWLLEVWEYYGKGARFDLLIPNWIEKYPDIVKLIERAKASGSIEVWPSLENGYMDIDCKIPNAFTIRIPPATYQALRSKVKHNRQATVNDQKVDMRNATGRMLIESPIENLADVARIWLFDLENDENPRVRSKCRILLTRLIGFRGEELTRFDSVLKNRIVVTLTSKRIEGMNVGNERERERECASP
jgi:hypothetical protein